MLKFEIDFTLRSGNSGCFYWAHDTGGFSGLESGELLARWIQFSTLSATLRLHGVGKDRRPWTWEPQIEESARIAYHLRARLMPYVYSSARQCTTETLPLLRPLYLEYPACDEAYLHMGEYFFGDHLLVAPVTAPGTGADNVASQTVWIPEGGPWYNWFSGQCLTGGQSVVINSSLNEFPLLVRAGTPIPLQPYTQRMTTEPLACLRIRCWPGEDGGVGTNTLYEDDGQSRDYETGAFATTQMSYVRRGSQVSVTVEPTDGQYRGQLERREIVIELPCTEEAVKASANGSPVALRFDAESDTAIVTVPDWSIRKKLTVTVDF